MSAADVDQPRLSRTAPCARSPGNPIAASTCDGWTLPEEQAEPDDTAIPARSKPITAVSALIPGTVKRVVFGNLGTSSEKTIMPGVCFRPCSRRSLKPIIRVESAGRAETAALATSFKILID